MRSAIQWRAAVRRAATREGPQSGRYRLPRRSLSAPYFEVPARKYLTIEAARRLHQSAGLLAAEAWLEKARGYSREEAYRKALWAPLLASTLSLFANLHGATDSRRASSAPRALALLAVVLAGVSEAGIHARQAVKGPDGRLWSVLGSVGLRGRAPVSLGLSGLLGLFAEHVRNTAAHRAPALLGVHAGRVAGLATAAGLVGASGEALLLPLRGVFHNPFMYVPLSLPPVAASLVARASLDPHARAHKTARTWLWVTAGVGMAAAALRAYGVSRAIGGAFRARGAGLGVASIPIPPRSVAWALAGLAALGLLDDVSSPGSPRAKGAAYRKFASLWRKCFMTPNPVGPLAGR